MILILVLTIWGMVENLSGFIREGEIFLVVLSGLILVLTAWLTASSLAALFRKND
jgi:hypothetical protein